MDLNNQNHGCCTIIYIWLYIMYIYNYIYIHISIYIVIQNLQQPRQQCLVKKNFGGLEGPTLKRSFFDVLDFGWFQQIVMF
jgi:hypothetical protein